MSDSLLYDLLSRVERDTLDEVDEDDEIKIFMTLRKRVERETLDNFVEIY